MNSIFDRLGEKLRNYLEDSDQDIFSNSKKPKEYKKPATDDNEDINEDNNTNWYTAGKYQQKTSTHSNTDTKKQNTFNNWNKNKAKTENTFHFSSNTQTNSSYTRQNTSSSTENPNSIKKIPQELFKDFIRLGLSPSATLEACKEAHKSLLKKYHPDKHTGNEYALVRANEMSANINMSYQRILTWFKTGKIE